MMSGMFVLVGYDNRTCKRWDGLEFRDGNVGMGMLGWEC
jgi:hypothetical protein